MVKTVPSTKNLILITFFLATPSTFIINRFITYNMATTVYWTPANNAKNHTISYNVEYRQSSQPWTSFPCRSPQWFADSGSLACLFLTCNATVLDVFYEVRIRAKSLSSNVSAVTPITVHNPSDEGKFVSSDWHGSFWSEFWATVKRASLVEKNDVFFFHINREDIVVSSIRAKIHVKIRKRDVVICVQTS